MDKVTNIWAYLLERVQNDIWKKLLRISFTGTEQFMMQEHLLVLENQYPYNHQKKESF